MLKQSSTLPKWASSSRRNIFHDESCKSSIRKDEKSSASIANPQRIIDKVPKLGGFASNHVMINRARAFWNVEPLRRSLELDNMARLHAQHMARLQRINHVTNSMESLRQMLNSEHVGENVQRGSTIHEMHIRTIQNQASKNRKNMQDQDFHEFGIGTAKGSDGKLYLCQLFRSSKKYNRSPGIQSTQN